LEDVDNKTDEYDYAFNIGRAILAGFSIMNIRNR
jgi:hypothetical protein